MNTASGFRKIEGDSLKQSNPKLKAFDDIASSVFGIWVHTDRPPFNDVRVRQAVSLAVSRQDLIDSDLGGAVHAGFLPITTNGDTAWPQEKIRQTFTFDPERAKKLLTEAGFTSTSPYMFRSSQTYAQHVEVIAKNLEAVGIKSVIEIAPGSAVTPVIARGDWDIAYGPFGGGRLPDFWLGDLLRTGSVRNVARYADPKFDAMSQAQSREVDPAKRKLLLDQMQQYLTEQMPWIPAVTRIYYHFQSCQTQNMRPHHNSLLTWGLEHAWVDPTGC